MKLLLHCCCAPCTVSCISSLKEEGITPDLLWYNPNIHPYTEYKSRRGCLSSFAANENLALKLIGEYGLRLFLDAAYDKNEDKNLRCTNCYRLRLERTAAFAAQDGYGSFSTTLLISPYQNHEAIKSIGEELAQKYGLEFLYRDFRPLFREGQSKARAIDLYMQKYCGCIFSEEERFFKVTSVKCGVTSEAIVNQTTHPTLHTTHCYSSFERLKLITGSKGLSKLKNTKVIVFGVGGVGSWCAEALVRSGIGKIGIVDFDKVTAGNINRQVQATSATLGESKVDVLKKRLLEINPDCEVSSFNQLFCRENINQFNIEKADYVIDAIDSLPNKIDLIENVFNAGVTLFSSMGMALKMDPSRVKAASIWETKGCPLARNVRQELRKRGFTGGFTTVYSDELIPGARSTVQPDGKSVNGSIVTVTATAGLLLAGLVINNIIHGLHGLKQIKEYEN